jgi:hypothetical protein
MVYSQDLKHISTYHHEGQLDWEAQDICSRLQERSNLNSQVNVHHDNFGEEKLKKIIGPLLDLDGGFQAESFNKYIMITYMPDLIYVNAIRLNTRTMKEKIISKAVVGVIMKTMVIIARPSDITFHSRYIFSSK